MTLPKPPTDLNFKYPHEFANLPLFDSGPGNDRILILGDKPLLDGLI